MSRYHDEQPSRAEIDAMPGVTILEFGANWCPICQHAQPTIAAALAKHPGIRHLAVADGRGKPLGRSFGVKLWPTLVALRDGQEVGRIVRPTATDEVAVLLARAT